MKADHLFKSAGLQLPSFQGISWYHTPWTKTWSLHFPTARSARKSEQKWVPFAAHSFLGRGAMLRPGLRTGIWYPVVSAAIRCNKNSTLCWEKTGCTVNRGFSVNRLHQQNIWFPRFVLFFVIFKAVLLFCLFVCLLGCRKIDPGIQNILKRKAVVYATCAQGHSMQPGSRQWSIAAQLHQVNQVQSLSPC